MPEAPDLSGVTVLVVDHDGDSIDLYRIFLESRHARVVALGTAAAALHYLGFAPADVLLTATSALGAASAPFIRAVHTLPQNDGLPIIAITGSPQDMTPVPDGYGFDAIFLKPVELDEIAATIVRLVSERRARALRADVGSSRQDEALAS